MNPTDRTTRWLTASVAVTAPLVIVTSGAISYSSLYALSRAAGGYGEFEAHLFPFPIDFTLGGAIAASFLLARWRAPFWARFWIGLQVALSALVTISGNALHGSIVGHHGDWPWALRIAVSAVPGAAIVGMTHTVTIMLRARPHAREERSGLVNVRTKGSAPARAKARPARSGTAPKEARVRALLLDAGIPRLMSDERAALIARVANEVEGSRSYVRKIAGRIEGAASHGPTRAAVPPDRLAKPDQEVA